MVEPTGGEEAPYGVVVIAPPTCMLFICQALVAHRNEPRAPLCLSIRMEHHSGTRAPSKYIIRFRPASYMYMLCII